MPISMPEISNPMGRKLLRSATTVSIAASGSYVVPAGFYYVLLTTNTKVQILVGTTWTDFTAANVKTFIFSDGQSVRIYNGGTSAESPVLVKAL